MPNDQDYVQAISATLSEPRDNEALHRRPVGLTFQLLNGPRKGETLSFPTKGTITGGRAPVHDIVLNDPSVSTNHFEIALRSHGVLLRDLDSTNGTWIGRGRLQDGVVCLFDGATFYAGNVKLRLEEIEVGHMAHANAKSLGTMTGGALAMRELFAMLVRVAPTPITTLVTGETGTGKEEVARTLHALSGRRGPFVVLDCGALPTGLSESAIFGHVRGAFTGASSSRKGAFEQADGGTLLLDEIGELPLELQPKLLRAIDRKEIVRVGDAEVRNVDVRVVAATHRNLAELVAEEKFRKDLYHRLSPIELTLPRLRERAEDIPLLAQRFLDDFAREHGRAVVLGDGVADALMRIHWDGNVRQLQQKIELLAFLVEDDVIKVEDVRRFADPRTADISDEIVAQFRRWMSMRYKEASEEFQRHYFSSLFERENGSIEEIIRRSGYSRKGLHSLAHRFGLPWGSPAGGA